MNISKRVFSHENILLFTNCLESIIPTPVNDHMNMTFNSYFSRVFDGYDAAYPIASRPVKGSKDNSWINLPIKRCIRRKARLYRMYIRGTIFKYDYTYYKNRLTVLLH